MYSLAWKNFLGILIPPKIKILFIYLFIYN